MVTEPATGDGRLAVAILTPSRGMIVAQRVRDPSKTRVRPHSELEPVRFTRFVLNSVVSLTGKITGPNRAVRSKTLQQHTISSQSGKTGSFNYLSPTYPLSQAIGLVYSTGSSYTAQLYEPGSTSIKVLRFTLMDSSSCSSGRLPLTSSTRLLY